MQWQNQLIALLNSNARNDLEGLHNKWAQDKITLTTKPLNLDDLATAIKLLQASNEGADKTVASFDPIDAKYATLKKFDFQISDEEEALLVSLRSKWQDFKATMVAAEKLLSNSKKNMQKDVENALDDLVSETIEKRKIANQKLPFSDDLSPKDSMAKISAYVEKVKKEREAQANLRPGLEIFNIEEPEYKETADTERDIEILTTIWQTALDWETKWENWKTEVFKTLETTSMENEAAIFLKRIGKSC